MLSDRLSVLVCTCYFIVNIHLALPCAGAVSDDPAHDLSMVEHKITDFLSYQATSEVKF